MTSASENADRLSNFPEKVLTRILSGLPTKFAVQTCVLSKSWRYRWTSVHSLDFDDNHHSLLNKNNNAQFRREYFYSLYGSDYTPLSIERSINRPAECFSTFVDRVFELLKTSQVKKFRLHITRILFASQSGVSEWINKAIMLNVCELDIRFKYNEIPSSIFTSKTLTKLTLHVDKLNRYRDYRSGKYISNWDCPSPFNLPLLKTLNIFFRPQRCVDLAFKVIHACPVLENLSLEIWSNDEDYTFKIPTLRKLKLTIWKSGPVNKVFLNVPNLEHLFLDGDLCSIFFMEDLSSKTEARVTCEVNDSRLLGNLLTKLSGAKCISSTTYPIPNGKHASSKYPNLKRLELNDYIGLSWKLFNHILEHCSELEYLSIEKPIEGCWNEPESPPACMLSLKTLKYANATCYWDDMQFLKFILGNSNVLKTLKLWYAPTLSDTKKTRLRENLAVFAKASKDCEICFVES